MLSKNSHGSFDEYPENSAEHSSIGLSFLFPVQIIERLLHGLSKPLPEPSWIEVEEFLVEGMNCVLVIHHSWSWVNICGLAVESASLRLDEIGLRFSKLGFQKQDSLPDTHHYAW